MENKYCGAVFFDIDGTLIPIADFMSEDERKKHGTKKLLPPISAKNAIKELNRRGYLTAIATGRSEDYMRDLGVDISCIISANGSVVRINGEIVHTDVIPAKTANAITDYCTKRKLNCLIETAHGCFSGVGSDSDFLWAGKRFPTVPHGDIRIGKLITYFDEEILAECEKLFGDEVTFMPHRYDTYMDINAKGVSKASGIMKVLEIFGIDINASYAFGDDLNDVEMLSAVGHGIAMTPHAAALDGIVEYVTDSVNNDGIFKGLRHYGLI